MQTAREKLETTMKHFVNNARTYVSTSVERSRPTVVRSLAFLPGGFFLVLGLVALFAPKFLLALLAGFFIFVGALLCAVTWKLFRYSRRIHEMSKELKGKLIIQGIVVQPPFEGPTPEEVEVVDNKKIVFH